MAETGQSGGAGRKSKEQPIIIKKIKKGGHGHHGGAWKVAYADFVTAMMAFFIVMWILSAGQEAQEQVAAYFNEPGAFNFLTGKRAVPVDLGFTPEPGRRVGDDQGEGLGSSKEEYKVVLDEETKNEIINEAQKRAYQQAVQDSIKAAIDVEVVMENLQEFLEETAEDNPEMADILQSIDFQLFEDGLRIELIETDESVFFKVGSAELRSEIIFILKELGNQIGKLPNNVEIEGHTDARGYSQGAQYTNWELSSDRANAARRILDASGLWDGQISKVTGYADRILRLPDNPFDKTNRRITIFIRQMNIKEFIG